MEKAINFEIGKDMYGTFIMTNSKYADDDDKKIAVCEHNMYEKMEYLAKKYNNHPIGCICVTFTMAG